MLPFTVANLRKMVMQASPGHRIKEAQNLMSKPSKLTSKLVPTLCLRDVLFLYCALVRSASFLISYLFIYFLFYSVDFLSYICMFA